jgi:choline dehydrogenase
LGAAGGVLTKHFNDACDRQVLVIELGVSQSANPYVTVPAFYAFNWGPSSYTIPYRTTPQPQCLNLTKNYLRGATWGGSATINAHISNRGTNLDFADWADITGDSTWNFANVLPSFNAVENNLYQSDPVYHGHSGFLQVSRVEQNGSTLKNNWFDPNNQIVFNALNSHGVPYRADLNGNPATETGWSYGQESVGFGPDGSGIRSWSGNLATSCSKINILSSTLVTKILFSGSSNRAIGVQYVQNVSTSNASQNGFQFPPNFVYKTAYARKGVILSAGVFNTPQILKLSGIGPRHELSSFGIPVLYDAPGVGGNLQDHPEFAANYVFNNPSYIDTLGCTYTLDGNDPCFPPSLPFNQFYGNNGVFGIADWPADSIGLSTCHTMFGTDFAVGSLDYNPPVVPGIYGFLVEVQNTLSRGTVTLASRHPWDYPVINPNYFSDAGGRDFQKMKSCWNFITQVMGQTSVQSQLSPNYAQGRYYPTADQVNTTQKLESYLRNITWGHHASGTARMGRSCDAQAVLDSKLRVYGTQNLYVVDASAFPKLTRGNPTFDVYMLAEKGYFIIRGLEPSPATTC